MTQFGIYADDVHIGSSSLEHGDPPMGVVYGNLIPTASYRAEQIGEGSVLTVRLDGAPILSSGEVVVEDWFQDFGEIQVTIFGIDHRLYEELFPEHVAAYQTLFGDPPSQRNR
jgi:hypothetical protein